MPHLDARGEVHGEGGADDLGVTRPHAPTVVGPCIARTCRIASPVSRSAGLELLLIGVVEVGVGGRVDVVVDANVVFIGVRGRRSAYYKVVGEARALGARIIAKQLGADGVGSVSSEIGKNVALNRIADVAIRCSGEASSVRIRGSLGIGLTGIDLMAASWIVDLALVDRTAK